MIKIVLFILLVMLMILPIVGIFYLDSIKQPVQKDVVNMQTENFTKVENLDIIKPLPQEKNIYIRKYQYIKVDNIPFGLGNKSPNIYFKVFSDIQETTPEDNNKIYSLKDFAGKVILINFWASWCESCIAEFPIFQKFYLENPDIVILMINVDNSDYKYARDFMDRNGFTLPVVYDAKDAAYIYYVNGIPRTVLIDKDGMARNVKIGYFIDQNELNFFVKGVQ